jgi:hypothetical protein
MTEFIMPLFDGSMAQITFFTIFAICVFFTVMSLIFGHDGDGGDVGGDVDHDFDPDAGHEFDGEGSQKVKYDIIETARRRRSKTA